jgi:regulator of protease activity HflC (stomatin/prohibitin superfamily)
MVMNIGNEVSPRKVFSAGLAGVVLILLVVVGFNVFEYLDAGSLMVIQSPIKGELTWYITQGIKYQGLGRVTKYPRRQQFWFSMSSDQGKKDDQSIPIRFNDGGHGRVSGSLSYEMPVDSQHLTSLHTKYGSPDAIEHQLVRTVVEKAVYMTGPLMSSQESYASRRNELLNIIDDQIIHGVYKTETTQERQKDAMTGQDKTVSVVKLVKGQDGQPLRQDLSPLEEFGIKVSNLSINKIPYDETVEQQIKQQQQAIMQVQTAIAKAKEAEQNAITVGKEGEALAAKAKWEQEVIKAQQVTEAQQKLEVARLDAQAAAQFKQAETLRGEGEAARRRAVMQADGALEIKVKAWLEAQKMWSEAVKGYQGNWVPNVVMGGGAGGSGSGAQQLVDLLTVKTAKELGLDMSTPRTAGHQAEVTPVKK